MTKSLLFLTGLFLLQLSVFAQYECEGFTAIGTSSSPITPVDPTCELPCEVEGLDAPWTGAGCDGIIVVTTDAPVLTITLVFTAVNIDDYATVSIDGGGVMSISGLYVGVSGDVIGPYDCVGAYGHVAVTISSTLPFSTITILNTGCSSGWVIGCMGGGAAGAGEDDAISFCDGTITISDLLSDGAALGGVWNEITESGAFDEGSTDFDASLAGAGTYLFEYIVAGCDGLTDTANFEITVADPPTPYFEFVVAGLSSEDGATGGCIVNAIQFNDLSTIDAPAEIVSWDWDFGDGDVSALENPTHTYGAAGTYTVTLTVTTSDGCTETFTLDIIMTSGLSMDILTNNPTCFGFSDGSITVNVLGETGELTFQITNADGELLNEENSNTANTLGEGWYYINVDDGSDCTGIDSVFIDDPDQIDIDLTITDPLCFGFETGWTRVDSVFNATGDYDAISYIWNPNPAGVSGTGADSSYAMGAGDYTLTINDQNGCSKTFDFQVTEPDSMYFSEFGFEHAYCRLHEYQSGNGVVFGAASGGTPDYNYLWTNLDNGETVINSTWGGLNPGNYELSMTDANGCVLTQKLFLDSLNPIADFTVNSEQLNGDLKGTAPVEVSFTNTSQNFANINNPLADTTFFWNLNTPIADWELSHDWYEVKDTTYTALGQTYTVDVCLVAINQAGCSDTACKVITIFEPIAFTDINIFTPNGDGKNDVFSFDYRAASISEFSCVIVNRWGATVNEMDDITDVWDGTNLNGNPCPDGVYFYTYRATTDNGTVLGGQGTVQIIANE